MGQLRVEKVQELIKQELSQIIMQELKDPRIGFVTVTQVAITGDLQTATVFVSLLGSESDKQQSWEGLNAAHGFMRAEIGKRIRLRLTPELILKIDNSLEYSEHINKLLAEIAETKEK